jgi:hypothetical protein
LKENPVNLNLTLKQRKPRNPVAMAAAQRLAGAHRPSIGAQRQRAKRALRQAWAVDSP